VRVQHTVRARKWLSLDEEYGRPAILSGERLAGCTTHFHHVGYGIDPINQAVEESGTPSNV